MEASNLFKETLNKLIPFAVRQAHRERNQCVTVRPEPVEGLNQSFLKPLKMLIAAIGVMATPQASGFSDGFDSGVALYESATMTESNDKDWWLNSGAYFYRSNGIGMTVQGELADNDRWRLLYANTNPVDTDNGYRPQNIFRLVTRSKFKNFTQQVYFNIARINVSESPNRNESNGVLFFHRYQDGDNLYYAGIRVDGYVIVKKKINGKYYTLKSVGVYEGTYNSVSKPNLIPTNQWIGLRTVISDSSSGNVVIALYLNDVLLGPDWTKVLEVEDTGSPSVPLLNEGYAGIRTDFMDVRFDHYEAIENHGVADRCTDSVSPSSKSYLAQEGDGSLKTAAESTGNRRDAINVAWTTVKPGISRSSNRLFDYTAAPK